MKSRFLIPIFTFLLFFSLQPHARGATQRDSLIAETDQVLFHDSTEASAGTMIPFRSEIERAAHKHNVPPALLAAFCQEESGFDPWAERSEPSFYKNKKVKRSATAWSKAHKGLPTSITELSDRSKSMGLMQPMGEVAREQGYDSIYLSSLFEPFNSIDQGATLLKKLLTRYGRDTLAAISAYNQGTPREVHGTFANAQYVYRVNVAWRHYDQAFHYAYLHSQSKENLRLAGRNRNDINDSGSLAKPALRREPDSTAVAQNNGHAGGIGPLAAGYDLGSRYTASQDLPLGEGERNESEWDRLLDNSDTFCFVGLGIIIVGLSGLAITIRRFERRWTRLDNGVSQPGQRHFLYRSETRRA